MNKCDEQAIDVFQQKCLRRILHIKWQNRITNDEVLCRADIQPLSNEIRKRKWNFIGHILRHKEHTDCVTALTWAPDGKRKRGRPKTTWRRTVEKERSLAGWRTWSEAKNTAADRNKWKHCVEALCAKGHKAAR